MGIVMVRLAGISARGVDCPNPTRAEQQVGWLEAPYLAHSSHVFSSRLAVSTSPENAILPATRRPLETTAMVPFFVQFKCKLGQSYAVANALAEAEIASEIYSTAGDYDLLVKFYVDNATDIGHFVNEKVQVIPGIQDTHTIITFKAFGAG
jgi:DNA-binding Lrp family transcriptional regulator